MPNLVFKSGAASSVSGLALTAGQVLFAVNSTTGVGEIWFDKSASERILMGTSRPAFAESAGKDGSNNTITETYLSGLSLNDHTITWVRPDGSSGTLTIPDNNTDTLVNMVERGTTKAYLLGTTTAPTATAQAVTSVAETGVYFDTTAATLVATTFKGKLDWGYIQQKPTIVKGALATNTASSDITIQLYDLDGSAIVSDNDSDNGVIVIPAANGSGTGNVAGLVTTSAQIWAGNKSFTDNVSIGGSLTVTGGSSNTDSSSTSTGALVVEGGMGVAKNVYIGGTLNVADTATMRDVVPNDRTYTLGTSTTGWKHLYLDSTNATAGITIKNNGAEYGTLKVTTAGGSDHTIGEISLTLGNDLNYDNASSTDNAQGTIYLYSSGVGYHKIQGLNTAYNRIHTLPAATGWIVTGGNGSNTGVATDGKTIMYLDTDGVLKSGLSTADVATDGKTLMYLENGVLTASSTTTVGGTDQAVYLNNGVLTAVNVGINDGTSGIAYYSASNTISALTPGSQYMILQQGAVSNGVGYPEWTGVIRPVTHNNSSYTLGAADALWHSAYISHLYIGDAANSNNVNGELYIYSSKKYGLLKYDGDSSVNSTTVYIPHYDGTGYLTHTASAAAVGSLTNPVYVDANGRITACTYNLNTTVNAGTSSQLAYYATNISTSVVEISPTLKLYVDNVTTSGSEHTYLAVNKESAPANSTAFEVVGTSTMQHIVPAATNTYDLGSSTYGWRTLYLDGTAAKVQISNDSAIYGTLALTTVGTDQIEGITTLILGNSTATGTAKNASGRITLYSASSAAHTIDGASTATAYTHTLPNQTGWLASGAAAGVGTDAKTLMYLANTGVLTASTETVATATRLMYLNSGTLTASTSDVGDYNQFVYLDNGTISATTQSIGASNTPIYMDNGVITASSSTIGSGVNPVFMSSGVLTASSSNVGSAAEPIYMSNGTITATSPVQYSTWSIASGDTSTTLTSATYYKTTTVVLALVITSGAEYLEGPMSWSSDTAGSLVLSTSTATTGAVSGYVITASAIDLSPAPAPAPANNE